MREIKFRAWDKERKEFNFIDLRDAIGCDDAFSLCGGNCGFRCECEIMQFTGLKDKNGKEIFEGDIVKVLGAFSDEEYSLFEIEWFECGFISSFIKSNDGIDKTGKLADSDFINRENFFEDCEVIGNKFENPKLLK